MELLGGKGGYGLLFFMMGIVVFMMSIVVS